MNKSEATIPTAKNFSYEPPHWFLPPEAPHFLSTKPRKQNEPYLKSRQRIEGCCTLLNPEQEPLKYWYDRNDRKVLFCTNR
ncbi:hypothetical protein TNCT_524641 [Trichonephila clavata]|uniref:Uncharacterized protein n=1 Tax=Trichonephila clavata TaxID=2740835 RepID=A0A8X6JHM0_TRICU|nr:hypothetical protein TNCT_524641 [Trichonephila clavata]